MDEQADLREELISTASNALRIMVEEFVDPGPDMEKGLSFSEIWQFFPKRRDTRRRHCEFGVGLRWCTQMFPGLKAILTEQTIAMQTCVTKEPVDASDSTDSSDSDSDLASSFSEADPPQADVLDWQMSRGSKGCLHIRDSCERRKTACGRQLFMAEEGTGLDSALATGRSWSPRCWNSLTSSEKLWWREAQTTE